MIMADSKVGFLFAHQTKRPCLHCNNMMLRLYTDSPVCISLGARHSPFHLNNLCERNPEDAREVIELFNNRTAVVSKYP
jgi:hypothetical protein